MAELGLKGYFADNPLNSAQKPLPGVGGAGIAPKALVIGSSSNLSMV